VAKSLSVAAAAGAVLVTCFLFRRLFRKVGEALPDAVLAADLAAGMLIAGGIVAVSPAFAVNSASGLETSLFSFLLVLGVFLDVGEGQQSRGAGSAVAFALAGLTRPEGFALFGVYWVGKLLVTARTAIRSLAVSALVVVCAFLGQMLFRVVAYDGEWLPNTYYAKQGGFWAVSAWRYISAGLLPPLLGIAGLAISVAAYWVGRLRMSRNLLPLVLMAVAGAGLPLLTGTDWMLGWRLVIPYLPLIAIPVAVGWVSVIARVAWPRRWIPAVVASGLLAALWVTQGDDREGFRAYVETRSRGYQTGHVALAEWLAREAGEGDTIALMDIGIVGYLCPRQSILDLTGLTDRRIAKSPGDFLDKSYNLAYILNRLPEFIVITLTAPGVAYRVPPAGTGFRAWTRIETNLTERPEFARHYVRKRTPANSGDWLDVLASQIGAERIFEHAHPGVYYLLAAFRRLPV
jgi:hypothetical protein